MNAPARAAGMPAGLKILPACWRSASTPGTRQFANGRIVPKWLFPLPLEAIGRRANSILAGQAAQLARELLGRHVMKREPIAGSACPSITSTEPRHAYAISPRTRQRQFDHGKMPPSHGRPTFAAPQFRAAHCDPPRSFQYAEAAPTDCRLASNGAEHCRIERSFVRNAATVG